ncbi:hypothetical protein HPB48_004934 [Haemaphysalis longicornis]|uniref:guanylate cyclase n=1 Tax=Haemaphysalis longicornis TaxID=44386 RepID=A0A9J6GCI8_HAELO|nr:hypothetical protein HPB48_004934 [Haemaphysalis longicornis]
MSSSRKALPLVHGVPALRPIRAIRRGAPRELLPQVFVVQTKEGVLKPRAVASEAGEDDAAAAATSPVLRLKGQMVSVEETQSILFLCSPRVKDIDDMRRMGLFFSDLAIHDPARELFLRSHHHRGERELIEKLDEATNRLRMLQSKLDEDKKRTEELLHSILPSKASPPPFLSSSHGMHALHPQVDSRSTCLSGRTWGRTELRPAPSAHWGSVPERRVRAALKSVQPLC